MTGSIPHDAHLFQHYTRETITHCRQHYDNTAHTGKRQVFYKLIDRRKTGRRTSVDIASAISLDVKYVNQIIRRAEGVQRERVGVSNRYWIEK